MSLSPPARLVLLLPLGGCFIERLVGPSEDPADTGPGDLTMPGSDQDSGLGADTTWGVSGRLVIVDGAPDPATSRLRLETRGVDCSVAATLATATALDAVPDGVTQAWTLEVAEVVEEACTWRGPTTLRLGLGATDPQLRPAADRAGVAWEASQGLYLSGAHDDLFLVGLATPAEEPETAVEPVELELTTLHGLPLDP